MDLKSFLAGSMGGFAGIIASHPFDTIKVNIQLQNNTQQVKGAWDIFKHVVTKQSPLILYRGISGPLFGSMFINSIVFGVESNVRKYIRHEKTGDVEYSTYAISGGLSGLLSSVFLTPIELVKIRMQIANSPYKTSWACLRDIIKNEGYNKLTRGFWLTALRETPAVSSYFVSFELILKLFHAERNDHKIWQLLTAGGIAGCMSWLVTYPVDVIKTRYQLNENYASINSCVRSTLELNGRRILWRGLTVTLMRGFPNNASCFATVYLFNSYFNNF
jgi:solute carrier family 25 (mitochondrial carnitine/acylcarnitine transporter), member 20/29